MTINSIETGRWGMIRAQESLSEHAKAASQLGLTEDDIVTPVTGMMEDSMQFKASATVVREEDEMQKAVLDMVA
jgi:hypothetical protein